MTDKDNVSMATVQMKADYAASEVYSTASEPPPAYKRQANSVKIAKITAFTIIVSSFVLGSFILASSYLQAKASCDQVQALDSVLEKELMLETLQQVNKELPRAEALMGKENSDEADLQNLDNIEGLKKTEVKPQAAVPQTTNEEETNENDNSYSEVVDEMPKFAGKVPLELDLSDLAATLLRNNKKSRMNCVVERKHAEEIVDSPSKTVALPFGVNLRTDPKKARITGERISIFCDGGDDSKEQDSRNNREEADDDTEEDVEPMRPLFIPYQRLPMPFGRIPQQFPLTHMPQRMMPPVQLIQSQQQQQQQVQHQLPQQPIIRQMPPLPPLHQLPLRPPMPPQMMQAPQQEQQSHNMIFDAPQTQTVRIHVQQIPFREFRVAQNLPIQPPSEQQELPHFQIQRLPLGEALQRAGITREDLRNIQRMAEERITDELKSWVPEEDDDDDSSNSEEININEEISNENEQSASHVSSEEQERQQSTEQQAASQPQQPQQAAEQNQQQEAAEQQPQARQQQTEENEQPMMQRTPLILQPLPEQPTPNQISPLGRVVFGRSLTHPVSIPVPMMQAQADASEAAASNEEAARPHFLQPRSSSFK